MVQWGGMVIPNPIGRPLEMLDNTRDQVVERYTLKKVHPCMTSFCTFWQSAFSLTLLLLHSTDKYRDLQSQLAFIGLSIMSF